MEYCCIVAYTSLMGSLYKGPTLYVESNITLSGVNTVFNCSIHCGSFALVCVINDSI